MNPVRKIEPKRQTVKISNGVKGIFVVGTDTGVGKTIITGLLARFFQDKGYKTITQKWIQTGIGDYANDIDTHLKFIGKKNKQVRKYSALISPYVFKFASSPHLAAQLEKRSIRVDKIKKSFKRLGKIFDFVIVEGAGGVLVPFNRKKLIIDIAKDLNLPVVVVAANKLGAINHTLLTIEALKIRSLKIIGIIFNNQSNKGNDIVLEDNPKIVRQLSGQRILGTLPWTKNKDILIKKFNIIGKNIISNLK